MLLLIMRMIATPLFPETSMKQAGPMSHCCKPGKQEQCPITVRGEKMEQFIHYSTGVVL